MPIDVSLGPDSRTLVITGPNTGGKTAALKTVGLLVLMARSGLHIPAHADSVLPRFTEVFVDLGDEQESAAKPQHLFSPSGQHSRHDGAGLAALAGAPGRVRRRHRSHGGWPPRRRHTEYFHNSGAMTLPPPTTVPSRRMPRRCHRWHAPVVDFDLDTLQPRYQLLYGLPGRSKAFAIAQKLGLPVHVIARAEQEAGLTQMRSEQLLACLEAERQVLETHGNGCMGAYRGRPPARRGTATWPRPRLRSSAFATRCIVKDRRYSRRRGKTSMPPWRRCGNRPRRH